MDTTTIYRDIIKQVILKYAQFRPSDGSINIIYLTLQSQNACWLIGIFRFLIRVICVIRIIRDSMFLVVLGFPLSCTSTTDLGNKRIVAVAV